MRDNSAEYTLTTPGGVFTFTRSTSAVTRLKDIAFESSIRSDITPRSQQHGVYSDPAYKDGAQISVTLRTRGSVAADIETSRTLLVRCLNSLLAGETGTLTWTNTGSATPIGFTAVYLLEDPQFAINGEAWDIHILFGADKPFAETVTATTTDSAALTAGGGGFVVPLTIPVTFTPSSGGEVAVTHSGDFPLAYPLLRVFGALTNPIVTNSDTGDRLVFAGSIADGDYWEIDLWERTVLLNGVTPIHAIDVLESTWFGVAWDSTTLQLSGSGFTSSTKLRTIMKSTWG